MKNKTVKYGAMLLICITLTLVAVLPLQRGKAERLNWMAELDDSARLNSLTIPGTHDSGALHSIAEISGKCQSLPVSEQLKIGVRFLDIRLCLVNNELKVVHSFTDQMTIFKSVLDDITSFIRNHKSEFLIVSIKEDDSPKGSNRAFEDVLEEMLLSCEEINRSTSLPETVGSARGKIHVIARYKNSSIGLPCYNGWRDDEAFALGNIYIQDNYQVENTEEKITDIEKACQIALSAEYDLVLNYTSCYLSSSFPPIYAGLPAHGINSHMQNVIANEFGDGALGVLVCDFITTELAETIIERNLR